MKRKKWEDLSTPQRAMTVAAASIELALTATAVVDLATRPSELVRGRKEWWAIGCLIQPFGPVAYLAWGRRTPLPIASG